jgi:hypothetical protein
MIVFDLSCQPAGHRFEAWFRSTDDFTHQHARKLLMCPQCGSVEVEKAVMAPAVARKGNQRAAASTLAPADTPPPRDGVGIQQAIAKLPPEAQQALAAMAAVQKEVLSRSRWVGGKFAEEARAIHYGEREAEPIYGRATPEEAEALADEGVEVAPLPFPVAPPDAVN